MIILFLFFLIIVVVVAASCVKIVPQARAYVVEFLGAYKTTWQTGLYFKIPFFERVAKNVTLKEQVTLFFRRSTPALPRIVVMRILQKRPCQNRKIFLLLLFPCNQLLHRLPKPAVHQR